jgi:inorganic pyrophosphatase
MNDDFWTYLDKLVAESKIVIDHPKGSHHPCYPEIIYPLDYGYLEGTTSAVGGGIDIWRGSQETKKSSAVIMTIDLHKRDAEIKILLGCTETEIQTILDFHNDQNMRATLVRRPQKE